MMSDRFIEFRNITKHFAGVTALNDVSLSIARGECHGLMGENGAGKSTLGKVLAGIHKPDEGVVAIDGQPVAFGSPADAQKLGIGAVHQELAFCPDLSVAENLCMGNYPRQLGLLNRRAMRAQARQLLARIGSTLDVNQNMRALSTAQEQMVQIAAAVGTGARILIFDEPTSSLSQPEGEALFKLIESLKAQGVTMIYVSHRMPELFRLCDHISVLRDGKYVGTLDRAEATHDKIVRMMIGRSVADYLPEHAARKIGPVVLKADHLSSPGLFEDVSFSVRAGEIVGMAGLVGAGRSETAKAIFGLDPRADGRVWIEDREMPIGSVQRALKRGIGLVPEDRKRQGLCLEMSGRSNVSMASLRELSRLGLMGFSEEKSIAKKFYKTLSVKAPNIEAPPKTMSGGNQQKVVLAKWLARQSKLLIIDEPTRGVDVGAKAAIHELVDELARQGVAILLISSELPELVNLSNRVLVMRDGRLVGELQQEQINQESVLRLMAGVQTA